MAARIAFLGLLALALALPAMQWWTAVGAPSRSWADATPVGQWFYLATKLTGMLVIALAIVQLTLSTLMRWGVAGLTRADHRVLGVLIALVVICHVATFVTATTLRSDHLTIHLLFPSMFDTAYERGVGLGALGFWAMLVGVGAAIWRLRWRWLHRLVLVAMALGLAHGLWIGSEKVYVIVMTVAAALVLTAFSLSRPRRRPLRG